MTRFLLHVKSENWRHEILDFDVFLIIPISSFLRDIQKVLPVIVMILTLNKSTNVAMKTFPAPLNKNESII